MKEDILIKILKIAEKNSVDFERVWFSKDRGGSSNSESLLPKFMSTFIERNKSLKKLVVDELEKRKEGEKIDSVINEIKSKKSKKVTPKKKCPVCRSSEINVFNGEIKCDKCGYINKIPDRKQKTNFLYII